MLMVPIVQICDVKGRKMSKSEGNVIDPLTIIDGVSHNSDHFAYPQQDDKPSSKDQPKSTAKKSKETLSQVNGYGTDNLRWTLVNYLEQVNFLF